MSSTDSTAARADRRREISRDVDSTSDAELRSRLVALEETRNIVEAEQAAVMVEIHRRAELEDAAQDGSAAEASRPLAAAHEAHMTEFVSDEIAVLLS